MPPLSIDRRLIGLHLRDATWWHLGRIHLDFNHSGFVEGHVDHMEALAVSEPVVLRKVAKTFCRNAEEMPEKQR
jgi:hypothetical protein